MIEVIRNKVYLEYDIYQEIIRNYRRIIKLLNKKKLAAYLPYFKDKRIIERIEREIYSWKFTVGECLQMTYRKSVFAL